MRGETAREEATTRALDALPVEVWRTMYDVCCPARRVANLDHIVVGPGGVFVIDSRDWSGSLEVRGQVLLHDGSNRGATVARVADAARGMAEVVLEVDPRFVVPVLCFDRAESVSGWAHDVLVCTTGNLVEQLQAQPPVWEPAEAERMFDRLSWVLPPETYRILEPTGPLAPVVHLTPWVRAALINIACCLVMFSAIRFGTWPGAVI